jgi:hypothetical protein
LQYSSPCIDTGDPDVNYDGQTDIDVQPRVMLGKSTQRADRGSDEYLKSDFNGDGIVNFVDYAAFAAKWKMMDPNISLDEDSDVDIFDLAQFCDEWLWISPLSPLYEMLAEQSEGDSGMAAGAEESAESVEQSSAAETVEESGNNATDVNENPTEDISQPVSDEQIQMMIDWAEQIWTDPEIREIIDPNDYQRLIDSLQEELNN